MRADDAARGEGSSIQQVSATYADSHRRILVANSDGLLVGDDQTRTRFAVQCVAVGDTGRQSSFEGPAGTIGFEYFDEHPPEETARLAARRAITLLDARPAPSGELPVVLKSGAGGVMFHEACGHGLEADLVGRNASVFAGRMGEQVASPLVTLVDDGTYAREWGTAAIDDEGQPAQRNVLIEDGRLTDYMWDLVRARKEGRRVERQRPAPDLPVPADGPDDQHLPAPGRRRPRGDHPPDPVRRLLRAARRRPGRHRVRRFRVRDHRGVPHRGRPRSPPRCARPSSSATGPQVLTPIDTVGNDFDTLAGHVRQGRPGRARLVGPARRCASPR